MIEKLTIEAKKNALVSHLIKFNTRIDLHISTVVPMLLEIIKSESQLIQN